MTFVDDIRGFEARTMNRVSAAFRSASEAFEKNRRFKETLREMEALSERELADLGLMRCDLPSVAYESVYGR